MTSTWTWIRYLLWIAICYPQAPTSAAEKPRPPAIYKCVENGVITFADRPCAQTASEPVSLGDPNLSASPVPSQHKARTRPQRRVTQTVALDNRRQSCERLTQSLTKIQAQLRAGYSVKEGERLHQRKRHFEEQRRDLRCGSIGR